MSEVEIRIRFVGSKNKFPSQRLKWLFDLFEMSKHRGERIPAMTLTTQDEQKNVYFAYVEANH